MADPTLVCRKTNQKYPYEILNGFSPALVLELHQQWEAEKLKIVAQIFEDVPGAAEDTSVFVEQLLAYGLSDFGWRWLDKAILFNGDEYHWFFLKAEGKIQSVCLIYHPKISRLDGDRIFYIDYLASAYWNRDKPGCPKRFGSVSRILIAHATNFAINTLGYRPGFCLHSLPTAEGYYRSLGMLEYEHDADKENLRYYEAPPEVAGKLASEASHG
ncbi:hypothetical protein [Pseudomonas sp. Pseusp97]|uniref:hypothetical protein n=1 Tax=Pseudomonas sp. Pseusp97 TaxID=3243065 RepID=UPI0039A4C0C8